MLHSFHFIGLIINVGDTVCYNLKHPKYILDYSWIFCHIISHICLKILFSLYHAWILWKWCDRNQHWIFLHVCIYWTLPKPVFVEYQQLSKYFLLQQSWLFDCPFKMDNLNFSWYINVLPGNPVNYNICWGQSRKKYWKQ